MAEPDELLYGVTDEAVAFLKRWEPKGLWVLTAIDPETRKVQVHTYRSDQEREAAAWINWSQGKRNVYFSVNRPAKILVKKAEKEEIAAALAYHVDVDPPKDVDLLVARRDIKARLEAFDPRPSVVLFSGGGYQAFWLLKEPVLIHGANDYERIESVNRGLERALGGDHCHNVDRIMRLPGTVNVPDKKKREKGRTKALAREEWADWGLVYDAEDKRFPRVEAPKADVVRASDDAIIPRGDLPEWVGRVAKLGTDPTGDRNFGGDRSRAVFAVAAALVRAGRSDREIVAVLLDPENGISEHIRDQAKPGEYALRQALQARAKVGEGFATGSKGILATQENIRLAMLRLGVDVSYDTFSMRYLIEGPEDKPLRLLDDMEMTRLWLSIEARWRFRPGTEYFYAVVRDAAFSNSYHPVRDYLNELKWDGVKRVDSWLSTYLGVAATPYSSAVGRLLLVAAARRARAPGAKFDEMVILESPEQGLDKSSALRVLAVRDEWFSDSFHLGMDEDKVIEALAGKWIIEVGELKGMKGAAVEALKQFLSKQTDRARLAWGKFVSEPGRSVVFVGTTNADVYLRDTTGNRRFWPIRIGTIDLAKLLADRDQLWAEAAALEVAGVSIRLDQSLWTAAAEEQSKRFVDEPWVSLVEKALERVANASGEVTGRILAADIWAVVNIPEGMRLQDHFVRLGEAMRALGWERTKLTFDGKIKNCYARGDAVERNSRIVIERDGSGVLDLYRWEIGKPNPRFYDGDGKGILTDNDEIPF